MKSVVRRVLRRAAIPFLAVAAIVAFAGTASADVVFPIGPDQYFTGLVNGKSANAVIQTDCTTPAAHPVNAHVSVGRILPPTNSIVGFTGGAANSIVADLEFAPSAGIANEEIGTLFYYGQTLQIPAGFVVPCTGTGTVAFLPAPADGNARPSTVNVTFTPIVTG